MISVVSRLVTSITTLPPTGNVFNTTSKVAEVPVSEVTSPLVGVTPTPGASSSLLVTVTSDGSRESYPKVSTVATVSTAS